MEINDSCSCGAIFKVQFSSHDFSNNAAYRHDAFLKSHEACRLKNKNKKRNLLIAAEGNVKNIDKEIVKICCICGKDKK